MEREEHWNTICLGIVTVATAEVGTAVFASGLTNIDLSNRDITQLVPDIVKVLFAGAAIVLYVFVGTLSGVAMFRTGHEATPEARADDKRNRTSLIYWLFIAELIALICLLASNVFEGQIGSLFPAPDMD
jgi:hypothetical protein